MDSQATSWRFDRLTHRWDDLRASADPGDGSDATKLVWDPLGTSGYTDIVAEVTAAGSVARQYWRGARLVSYKEAGQKGIYGFDHLGSTERVVDAAQAVLAAYRASAWGEALLTTGSLAGQRLQYGGEWGAYRDALSSDLWMRARVMAPEVGRFVSADRSESWFGGQSHFIYVANVPTGLTDPSGYQAKPTKPDPAKFWECYRGGWRWASSARSACKVCKQQTCVNVDCDSPTFDLPLRPPPRVALVLPPIGSNLDAISVCKELCLANCRKVAMTGPQFCKKACGTICTKLAKEVREEIEEDLCTRIYRVCLAIPIEREPSTLGRHRAICLKAFEACLEKANEPG